MVDSTYRVPRSGFSGSLATAYRVLALARILICWTLSLKKSRPTSLPLPQGLVFIKKTDFYIFLYILCETYAFLCEICAFYVYLGPKGRCRAIRKALFGFKEINMLKMGAVVPVW